MIRTKPVGLSVQRKALRLALALGLAGLTFLGAQGWALGNSAPSAADRIAMADIMVTARPIAAGARLAEADVRWQRWPTTAIDPAWLVRGRSRAAMIGRIAPVALPAGLPLSQNILIAPGDRSEFAAAIRPGLRAISVAVSPSAGLSGFIMPGDRVDVILVQEIGSRRTAQTLFVDLGVLGVDQHRRGTASATAIEPIAAASDIAADAAGGIGAEPPQLVTLEVTPRQAEALAIAADLGKLALVLRGPGAETAQASVRRWDSDVTGLSAALLASGADRAAAPGPAQILPTPPALAPSHAVGGVEIVYGLSAPANAGASK